MRKLFRSRYDKKFAGVCAGLGNYFSIDPVAIRLVAIFLCVLTGLLPIFIIYGVTALVIPLEPLNSPAIEYRRIYRSSNDRIFGGLCGGLAKILKMDSSVLRIIVVILTFVTGLAPMVIAYLVGWFIIPEKNYQ